MSDLPIEEHAFLSDGHSAALVTREGSVDWLCFPRFDAPSVLGRLLDPDAGHLAIRPQGEFVAERRYRADSLVLETTFVTATGTVVVTDALALRADDSGHQLGRDAPHALLRHVRCSDGEVTVAVAFAPRPEYGLARPLLQPVDGGVVTRGAPDALALWTEVPLRLDHSHAEGTVRLTAGQETTVALQWARAWEAAPARWRPDEVVGRLEDTTEAWQRWAAEHQRYEGPWRELVRFSGRVLQGLTFQPTGAVVAAATTSLPEEVGGSRNWDYRYAWLRDASLTLDALWIAACPDEARDFVAWLVGAAAGDLRAGSMPQIMYGVGGEHDLRERTLDHLAGWRESRPVRVGNGAYDQLQLDVFGEVLAAVARLRDQLGPLDETTRWFLRQLAQAAIDGWEQPDQGLWEVRSGPQHMLNSKLMCWVALDRAIELADLLGPTPDELERWQLERERVRAAILARGLDPETGAFTQAFGSTLLDASALRIPIVGFLPGDDARVLATIAAVQERLTDDAGFVRRYEGNDGLDGEEGSFLLCTFWLAHAQALAGDVDAARATFELAIGVRNDVDLLAEEYGDGQLLGNVPQAFSHIGLVTAAAAIAASGSDVAPR
ncbi:MAG: glycoside hydrolase family 15 protein [Nitriliruptoraceae bacterium]